MQVLGLIVIGLVIGYLARLFKPGRQRIVRRIEARQIVLRLLFVW